MIVTVTLNPAYDVTYSVPTLAPGEVHRVGAVHQRVGGKGVNVARVLVCLGARAVAMCLADKDFAAAARDEGVEVECVEGLAQVRRTLVVQGDDGVTTSLWEPGHAADPGPVAALAEQVRRRLASTAGLVVSGSLAPGVPASMPAELAGMAVAAGVPVLVDADDEALRLAAAVPGVVLMPNDDELARLTGDPTTDIPEVVDAADRLLAEGVVAVVATRGADGIVAVTRDGAWLARLDRRPGDLVGAGNPTGAGDAAAAAVIRGLAHGRPDWPSLLTDAVATSAAAVRSPVAGDIDLAHRAELLERVLVVTVPLSRSSR